MRKTEDLFTWRLFFRAVELGSLARVAEEAGIESSSVSRHLRHLESQLQIQLLHRSPQGVTLTGPGARVYARMHPLIEEIEVATRQLGEQDGLLYGSIRISIPSTLGNLLFIPWIAAFQQLHPALSIDVRLTYGPSHHDLHDGFDLRVTHGELPNERVIASPLGQVTRLMVASPNYLAAHGVPTHPQQLHQHRLVLYPESVTGESILLTRGDEAIAVPLSAALRINSEEGIEHAVIAHAGIELSAMRHQCQPHIDAGRLVPVMPEWKIAPLSVDVLRLPMAHPCPAQLKLIDWFQRRWRANPLLLPPPQWPAHH